jgi:RNA polymerase sigma factor (sigma-70 family)
MAMGTDVYKKWFSGFERWKEDIIMEAVAGFIGAEDKFDDDRGVSFSTFGYLCAKNRVLKYLRGERKYYGKVSDADLDDDFVSDIACDEYDDNRLGEEYYKKQVKKLREVSGIMRPKASAIANDILNCESFSSIAKKYGVSRQRVSQVASYIKKMARERFEFKDGEMVER